ncbi:PLD nuclease N-terminal domain-containing protein [Luteolibacter flavescens]|uniref:PLD nuclease N-terminal domain-containing protein n=1 Tax=Luteolibacter flavescens TaxID=1859460 RepID=A0ABT3FK61_9BACT|nr:PLD nuclease N-terminal domain-containing protein [Luteolibacter flavescens]MCW1883959.1 PLD nuclease N-terminal domain-containing protein [Luteolibacter flavescens]
MQPMNQLGFLNIGGQELILIFFLLSPMILSIIALIQCLQATFEQGSEKLIWVIVLLALPVVGPILWWTIGIKKAKR